MSKQSNDDRPADVTWTLDGDALRPKVAPWGFIVQNPVQVALAPGESRTINTGVRASVPLVAWPRAGADVAVPNLIPPGQVITVTVTNSSAHTSLIVDDREALVNVHPLTFSGTSAVA